MHYHVYVSLKQSTIPKDIFNFEVADQAVDRVMKIIEEFGLVLETLDISHTEGPMGRFSIILIPNADCKIILHECNYTNHNFNSTIVLDKSKLN